MARPRKTRDDQLAAPVAVRFPLHERQQHEAAAAAAGCTLSEYIRLRMSKGRVVVQETRRLDFAVFQELSRIGVNLNQLARVANATGRVPPDLAAVCERLERILMDEVEAYGPER